NRELAEDDAGERTVRQRMFDLVLASGYILRTKADGWKLFCERLNVPSFSLWKVLPGFDRLERALALAEKVAFVSEGFLHFLNRIRPMGEPELTEVPLTVEGIADETAKLYQVRVKWWGG